MPETQAFFAAQSRWTPPSGTLGTLVEAAHGRALILGESEKALRESAEGAPRPPSFRGALQLPSVALIAEIKRRSPSRGAINPLLDAPSRARTYVEAGAAAVSVLTEPDRFGGSVADLAAVAKAVSAPVLRKDFIVAAVQLYEARANGAAAALLIVRALSPAALPNLVRAGMAIGLDLLVEVRDEDELRRAIDAGADIIGVNNRNLESLEIDRETAGRILPLIPRAIVAVAESGMNSREDVQFAARAGADAVLVGSAVSSADDPGVVVGSLIGVAAEADARRN